MKRHSILLVGLAIWISAAMSLNRPTMAHASSVDCDKPLMLILLMDTSGSMSTSDPTGASREAVVTALNLIAHERPTTCLLEFSGQVRALVNPKPLTLEDLESIRKMLAERQATGTTQMDLGIKESLRIFRQDRLPRQRRSLVILSDGQIPPGQSESLRRYARDLAQEGIGLFCIELGSRTTKASALREFTTLAGGTLFRVEGGPDLVRDSCQAAIRIAMKLMPNNIYSFTDPQSALDVPREAQRVLLVVPKGVSLYCPGGSRPKTEVIHADESVHTSETQYAAWGVLALSRPTQEMAIDRYWQGPWIAIDAQGNRSTAWAFIQTDTRVIGKLVNPGQAAGEHMRVAVDVDLSSSAISPAGPYTVHTYLKPPNRPAHNVVEETLPGAPPASVEVELPPVESPGSYELVCQVSNPQGIVTGEHRSSVKVDPPHFQMVVLAVSPDGNRRVLVKSGSSTPQNPLQLQRRETLCVEVDALMNSGQQPEILSGGVTLEPQGMAPITCKFRADTSSPLPRLVCPDLVVTTQTRVRIGVRGDFRVTSTDPVTGSTTRSRRQTRAEWTLSLRPALDPVPEVVQVVADFQSPETIPHGEACIIRFGLKARGSSPAIRTAILRNAASRARPRVSRSDGVPIGASSNTLFSSPRIGSLQHGKSESFVDMAWVLNEPTPGEYLADLELTDLDSLCGEKIPVLFTCEGGSFTVAGPWVAIKFERTNRDKEAMTLRSALHLVDGDEGVFVVNPTRQMPPRIIDHIDVSVRLDLGPSTRSLSVTRLGQQWKTEIVKFSRGAGEARIVVVVPGQKPIVIASAIAVRSTVSRLAFEGLPGHAIPQDTVLSLRVRAIPEMESDLSSLVEEQRIAVWLSDEAGQIVVRRTLDMDSAGTALVTMEMPRTGHFTLAATMSTAETLTKTLEVTDRAVSVKLLASKPDADDTLSALLAKPSAPQELKVGAEVYPTIIPTEAFPVEMYRIAEARLVINGHDARATQNDGLHRWFLAKPWLAEHDGRVSGDVEVVLARVGGEGGLILRQQFQTS